jgi:hypothetical protein
MPLMVTPSLGVSINGVIYNALNPPKHIALGFMGKGDDGHDYVFAAASAVVAAGPTVVVLTEPAFTFATGAGAWTYTGAVAAAIGDQIMLKRTAI